MQGTSNDHDQPDTDDLVERALRGVDDVAVLVFDAQMRFRAVHGGATARHGFDPDALVGRRAPDVLSAPSWEHVGPLYTAALAGRTVVAETPADDGTVYETVFAPVLADGKVVGGTAVSRDVTAVREAQAAQDGRRRAESVAAARARFETAFAGAPVGMALLDAAGRFVQANAALARLLGRDDEALRALPAALELVAPADRAALRRAWRAALEGDDAQEVGVELLPAGAGPVAARVSLALLPGGEGEPDVVVHVVDVSALDRAQRELDATRALFEVAFHAAPVGKLISRLRADGLTEVLQCNAAMAALVGREVADVVGRSGGVLLHPGDLRARRLLVDELLAGRPCSGELRFLHADGRDVWTEVEAHVVPGAGGEPLAVLQVVDRTEARDAEQRLRRVAETDALTGTLSRAAVQATLERELSCAADAGRPTCLLRLDLDGFKHVNDLLGPEAGDALLHDLARVLRDAVRPTDVLGRLGGDEFAVLLPATELEVAIAVGGRLVDAVRLHGHVVGRRARAELTASCGVVAAAPDARTPAGELLQQAELALYDAKKAGRDRVATYDADAGVAARDARHDHWLGRLRRALAEDRLILHAQPLVPLDGVQDGPVRREVLLRLVGEEGELVPPAEFLAHAERHGLVVDLDLWVLRRTVARLRAAAAAGRPERLSVNLSARSVEDPRMAAELERLLAAVPLPAGALTIEITETAAIHDVVAAGALTRRLHELGARVALDDFGAGHACLAALKHFALDELKVDGSLVAGLASSPTDQLVVRAVVGIAAELGLDVVAEHVGDAATAALLREMGVDLGQGFLLGRPLPLGA